MFKKEYKKTGMIKFIIPVSKICDKGYRFNKYSLI
jgi:hypothetical protein